MARIQNIELDRNLTGADKFVGTDASNNATVNFSIDQLSEYFLQTGYADPSRIGFVYDYTRTYASGNVIANGELQVEFATPLPANPSWRHVVALHFNATSENGADFTPAAQIISNQIIKLTGVDSITDQAYSYYNVESVTRSGDVYTVRVSSENNFATGDLSLGEITITPAGQSNPNRIIGTGEILHGVGDPTALTDAEQMALGEEGDYYLQEDLRDADNPIVVLFGPKPADDLWNNAASVSLRGPQGAQGNSVDLVTNDGPTTPGQDTDITFSVMGTPIGTVEVAPGNVGVQDLKVQQDQTEILLTE